LLEIIYDLKSLDLYIREMVVKTYVRLGIKPNSERQLGSLLKAHLHYLCQQVPEGCHQPLDNITEIKVWKRPYKITIGDGMDTQLADKSVPDFSCYTDGSLMDGKAGAGSLIMQRTEPWLTQSVRMANGTVHQAELLLITNAAKLLAGETGKKILFLVDNQSSLKVLAGTNVKFDSVKMTRDALHSLGRVPQTMWSCGGSKHMLGMMAMRQPTRLLRKEVPLTGKPKTSTCKIKGLEPN
jgi:hypothetical protein